MVIEEIENEFGRRGLKIRSEDLGERSLYRRKVRFDQDVQWREEIAALGKIAENAELPVGERAAASIKIVTTVLDGLTDAELNACDSNDVLQLMGAVHSILSNPETPKKKA